MTCLAVCGAWTSEAEIGTVWVYISYLRKKLASLGASAAIRSKRGVGYFLEVGKMIRMLRRRFIWGAMGAFSILLVLVIGGMIVGQLCDAGTGL